MPVRVEILRKTRLLGYGTGERGDFAVRSFMREPSGEIPGVGQAITIKVVSGGKVGATLETQSGGLYGDALWITDEITFSESSVPASA
ncbi:MAG TPA: hypothetical protein VK512_01585 [Xanthobacteraceae bacterium]|nr:hypothetical protein [Xanthobacteraceae bacterium]